MNASFLLVGGTSSFHLQRILMFHSETSAQSRLRYTAFSAGTVRTHGPNFRNDDESWWRQTVFVILFGNTMVPSSAHPYSPFASVTDNVCWNDTIVWVKNNNNNKSLYTISKLTLALSRPTIETMMSDWFAVHSLPFEYVPSSCPKVSRDRLQLRRDPGRGQAI